MSAPTYPAINTAPRLAASALPPTPAVLATLGPDGSVAGSRFDRELKEQTQGRGAAAGDADAVREKADKRRGEFREAAGQLVAAAFILPLLAETRKSSMNTDLFGGGMGQDAMRQKLDVELAERLATSPKFPIVDAMVDRYMPENIIPIEVFRKQQAEADPNAAAGQGLNTHG